MSEIQRQESPAVMHRFPIRVYFEDTDAGRVVYHAGYLRFAERARTEMMRDLGLSHYEMIHMHGLMFLVSRVELDCLSPARLDDLLEVQTTFATIGGASVKMAQTVVGLGGDRASVVRAKLLVRLACTGADGRPARLPDEFIAKTRLATNANRI